MNKIICFAFVVCASMALASAYPAAGPGPFIAPEGVAPVLKADDEILQPEESRHGRHGWGHRGWGHGGYGYGDRYGYGGGWGHGGGWGPGIGLGYGGVGIYGGVYDIGYGGGYGYGGGWGGGW